MEPHEKLKVISVLKKSHKNFASTNLGLKVDQIYPYIAASLELLEHVIAVKMESLK